MYNLLHLNVYNLLHLNNIDLPVLRLNLNVQICINLIINLVKAFKLNYKFSESI